MPSDDDDDVSAPVDRVDADDAAADDADDDDDDETTRAAAPRSAVVVGLCVAGASVPGAIGSEIARETSC